MTKSTTFKKLPDVYDKTAFIYHITLLFYMIKRTLNLRGEQLIPNEILRMDESKVPKWIREFMKYFVENCPVPNLGDKYFLNSVPKYDVEAGYKLLQQPFFEEIKEEFDYIFPDAAENYAPFRYLTSRLLVEKLNV